VIQTGINALGLSYFDPEPQVELESEIRSTYDSLYLLSSSGPSPIGSFSPNSQATTTLSRLKTSGRSIEAGKTLSTGGSLVPTGSGSLLTPSSSHPPEAPPEITANDGVQFGSFTTDHSTVPLIQGWFPGGKQVHVPRPSPAFPGTSLTLFFARLNVKQGFFTII
jgi:hypothetical protein